MFSLFFLFTPPFQENLAVLAHMMDALKRDFSDAWTQTETLITDKDSDLDGTFSEHFFLKGFLRFIQT